jgi:hypothetical protein
MVIKQSSLSLTTKMGKTFINLRTKQMTKIKINKMIKINHFQRGTLEGSTYLTL